MKRIRDGLFTLEEIFNAFSSGAKLYNNACLRSQRATKNKIAVFIKKGTRCYLCGLEAKYFAKEKQKESNKWFFNLYGVKNGKEIEFTKDHIISKHNGGKPSSSSNLATCCEECNRLKGKLEI